MSRGSISRRTFLKGAGSALGLTLAITSTPLGLSLVNASGMAEGLKTSAFYTLTPENVVKILIPTSEMGQGAHTTISMILADELDADWSMLEIAQAPVGEAFQNPLLHNQLTVASASTRGWYDIMRKAGAAGREMLMQAAAEQWKVPVSKLMAEKGMIKMAGGGKSATYGQLASAAAKMAVPKEPKLKDESQFTFMGKYMERVDIPPKVSGKAVFGYDVEMPDLHYAVMAKPPAYGAKPEKFDEGAAMAVKGVVKVMPLPTGVAVMAQNYYAAKKGSQALKVQWSAGSHPQMDTQYVEKTLFGDIPQKSNNAFNSGDVPGALKSAAKVIEAKYYVPCVAHTTMEPMNFTAHVQKDRCDLWGPTQAQTLTQMVASQVSGLPPEKVFVNTTMLGCGLGRRARPEFVVEAVLCSKALGKPVKVAWTREDDIKHDYFRAPAAHMVKGGLDQDGKLIAWQHQLGSLSIMRFQGHEPKNGFDYYCLWGLVDGPKSPAKSHMPYPIPNYSVTLSLSDLPIQVAPWRSVQNGPNAFAIESFIDELAAAAGKDPVEFRLAALEGNPRAQRAVKTVAEKAGWDKPLPKGHGRGIAQHSCFGSYIAQVAEVSLNSNNELKIHRVDVAVDCGPIVNPNPLVAQIEGAVTMASSTVLMEEVQFDAGGVASSNWDNYSVIRMSQVPEIHVHLIKNSDPIGGIGEPGIPPLAPAVANALFNLTGTRVRRMPLTPEAIEAAMKA